MSTTGTPVQPETAQFATIQFGTAGRVARITLDRPAALNAITADMLAELYAALGEVAANPEISVVVLTGAGRSFSAGVDLTGLPSDPAEAAVAFDEMNGLAHDVLERIRYLDALVVAKVRGHCVTGGLELLLVCDLVVAADEARFGDTHAKWGLRPTWGMSQRLPARVGPSRARLLSYTAQFISGQQAQAWGLVARCCPEAELDTVTEDLVATLLANSPGSLAAYKDLYRAADERALPQGLAYEAATVYSIGDTAERLGGFA